MGTFPAPYFGLVNLASPEKSRPGKESPPLPDWAVKVPTPSTSTLGLISELLALVQETRDARGKGILTQLGFYGRLPGFLWKARNLIWEMETGTKAYLPAEAQARLSRNTTWSLDYWVTRWRNPGLAKRLCIAYEGPIAVKQTQMEVQRLEKRRESLERQLKASGFLDGAPWLLKPLLYILQVWSRAEAQRNLTFLDDYAPMLNAVPLLPRSFFQERLDALQTAYNAQHPDDPVTVVETAIKSGSMAQIFPCVTRSGKRLVMKVLRPDVTAKALERYRPYLYYKSLVESDTSSESRRLAAQNAQTQVDLLKRESDLPNEARNTRIMGESLEKLGIRGFRTPDILLASEHGLIMPAVGERDFIDLPLPERREPLQRIAPDLCRLALLGDAQPLDVHSGNIRVGKDGHYLLDHGRTLHLDPVVHRALQALMVAVYSEPDPDAIPDSRLVLQRLDALLRCKGQPTGKAADLAEAVSTLLAAPSRPPRLSDLGSAIQRTVRHFLTALTTSDHPPPPPETVEAARQTVREFLTALFHGPEDPAGLMLSKLLATLTPPTDGKRKPSPEKTLFRDLSVNPFALWDYYLGLSSGGQTSGLAPISREPIAANDLRKSRNQLQDFVRPYFTLEHPPEPSEEAEILARLKTMTPETFYRTYAPHLDEWDAPPPSRTLRDTVAAAQRYQWYATMQKSLDTLEKKSASYRVELHIELHPGREQALKDFQANRNKLLSHENQSERRRLLSIYCTYRNLAEQLADALLEHTEPEQEEPIQDTERRQTLIRRLEWGLQEGES
jgi:hypothetical protein